MIVTRREAAAEIGCSVDTIAKRLREADAPERVGVDAVGAYLYDLDELRDWILRDRVGDGERLGSPTLVGDSVTCLECGQRLLTLRRHLERHDMSMDEYRERHRLPFGAPLTSIHSRAAHKRASEAAGVAANLDHARQGERQAAGVPHLRESRRARQQTPAMEASRAKAVAAMEARKREVMTARMRALGHESIEAAIEATAHLSVTDAARTLGIGKTTLRRWRTP